MRNGLTHTLTCAVLSLLLGCEQTKEDDSGSPDSGHEDTDTGPGETDTGTEEDPCPEDAPYGLVIRVFDEAGEPILGGTAIYAVNDNGPYGCETQAHELLCGPGMVGEFQYTIRAPGYTGLGDSADVQGEECAPETVTLDVVLPVTS